MTMRVFGASVVVLATALVGLVAMTGPVPDRVNTDKSINGPFTVDGPYTHENLSLYVIRGKSHDTRQYLTLDEGLTAGLVAVREKGARQGSDRAEVNSLEIENRSDKWLFLQAGDIVKGGKQDRTIMTDLTLPPRSRPTSIDAFCVEHGRWRARDGLQFGTNTGIVSGVALKRAIQGEKSQPRVWEEVAKADVKAVAAARASGDAVADRVSTLSSTGTYNAIVEQPTLRVDRTAFVTALLPQVQKDKSAIGIAVAINGEITSADVYASPSLLQRLSRKLLDSYATEAVFARQSKAKAAAPGKEAVVAFLSSPSSGRGKVETVGGSMHQRTVESDTTVLYEYAYRESDWTGHVAAARPVHQNYLKKQ